MVNIVGRVETLVDKGSFALKVRVLRLVQRPRLRCVWADVWMNKTTRNIVEDAEKPVQRGKPALRGVANVRKA